MKNPILERFGRRIQQERVKQGLSQEELAEKANVHRTYIGMIERAEKNITLLNIEKIANALNINSSDLLKDDIDSWHNRIEDYCTKYNIPSNYLSLILQDSKVIPMIRGKAFEFSALLKFREILDINQWSVNKLNVNPQLSTHDEDLTITHLETGKNIRVECKLAAKGKYKLVDDGLFGSRFNIQVKCMRSRTRGETITLSFSNKTGISQQLLKIHNDQYLSTDFDLVVTSIANAFYVTYKQTDTYEWKPSKEAIRFLKILNPDPLIDLDDPKTQQSFAFNKMYIASSNLLNITQVNKVIYTRKQCSDKYNCGFIPNYPQIVFDLATGKPLEPWFSIEDCMPLLNKFI